MDVNSTVAATTAMLGVSGIPVATTGGTEAVIQLVGIGLTVLFATISFGVGYWLKHSTAAAKWKLNNDKVESILQDAVHFAEGVSKAVAANAVNKKGASIDYFNKVAPELVKQYGDAIGVMVERKANQMEMNGFSDPVVTPAENTTTTPPVQ